MEIRKSALWASVVFLLSIGGGGLLLHEIENRRIADRRLVISQIAASASYNLERQLSRSLSAAYALASLLRQKEAIDHFESLAADMIASYGGISSLQLAPNGIVSKIHPLPGNEKAIGHDLLRDPERRTEALAAIASRRMTLAGPFELRQGGGTAVVGRLAVFLPGKGGPERFWGFAIVLIRLPELLSAAKLDRLVKDGYDYELSRSYPDTGARHVFVRSGGGVLESPVTFPIEMPNGMWTLSVAPKGGWGASFPLTENSAFALAASLALSLLAYNVLRRPELLRVEVQARTRDLFDANRKLEDENAERVRAEEGKAKLQEQLQQAMKMEAVGRLAGGVAHDFNNLLTVIMGNIALSLMKLSASDPAAGLLAEANKGAERAAALTQQLLAFSRKQIIAPKVLGLNELIVGLHTMLVRLIGEDIHLQTVPGGNLGLVKIDAGQFEQVLVNLAVNARDAMPEGGKLLIETANADLDDEYCARHPYIRPGRFVLLAVSDTGHGMSEEVKKQIFEPFFTTKPMGIGTGLGLAMIYGVVKQSNGSIEVYTEVGQGTTFKIYLPRVEGETARPEEPCLPMELLEGSETVLLVEDEEIVRNLCFRVLERLGYRVMPASNGDEAIALAMGYGERIDLLMTDVVMPGMHGRELAIRLARIHPETRVLFTSGYTDNAIVHHGVLDEGVSFIGKPYTPSALAKKVREVLDKS